MKPGGLIIAIDGPSGAGKSTVSRELARRLGYAYVDTGAMYRVVGLLALESGVDPSDEERLRELASTLTIRFDRRPDGTQGVLVDGREVTKAIRREDVSQWASRVSAVPAVRLELVRLQREAGARGGAVLEGRDVGTVVFPDADVKFFLDAAPTERARRRTDELCRRGEPASLDAVRREMEERDRRDQSRAHSPLRPAEDAMTIDSTGRTIEEVLEWMMRRCEELKSRK